MREQSLKGNTYKYKIACGSIYIILNKQNDKLYEMFIHSKDIKCLALVEGMARLISMSLRLGNDINEILNQIKPIRCIECSEGLTCTKALSKALEEEL